MGLEAWGRGGAEEEEKEEEIPHMCESIGHRPLRRRCPAPPSTSTPNLLKQGTGTADHLTLLRLFLSFFLPSISSFNPSFIPFGQTDSARMNEKVPLCSTGLLFGAVAQKERERERETTWI